LLIFSTNFRKFRFDSPAFAEIDAKDVTAATIPHDFERNRKIHQCFEIRVPSAALRAEGL
jgi:23S rRNA (guanine2445-N2)-methyltransferase / 23S rRNA (guanine2069-N7)-methyltransferase